jgi:hypothetical protein
VSCKPTPTGDADYPKTILGEQGLVFYWRLQDKHVDEPPSSATDNAPTAIGYRAARLSSSKVIDLDYGAALGWLGTMSAKFGMQGLGCHGSQRLKQ